MKPIPVTIRGVTYASMGAAARAFQIDRSAVSHAVRCGTIDNIGLGNGRKRDEKGRFVEAPG